MKSQRKPVLQQMLDVGLLEGWDGGLKTCIERAANSVKKIVKKWLKTFCVSLLNKNKKGKKPKTTLITKCLDWKAKIIEPKVKKYFNY